MRRCPHRKFSQRDNDDDSSYSTGNADFQAGGGYEPGAEFEKTMNCWEPPTTTARAIFTNVVVGSIILALAIEHRMMLILGMK